MKKIVFLLSLLILLACNSDDDSVDCSNALPPPNSFRIEFRNQANEALLETQFLQDSFKFSSNNSVQYLKRTGFDNLATLGVGFESITSGTTYQLELDSENIDSFKFNFTVTPGDCGDSFTIDTINYNGEPFLGDGNLPFGEIISFTRN